MTSTTDESKNETLAAKILRHWHGNGRLSWAYWSFHFGGGLILLFLMAVGFLAILPFAYHEGIGIQQSPIFGVYVVVFGGCYLAHAIMSIIMVWRCGPNVKWKGWMSLSRAQLMLWILNWAKILGVAIGAL